MSSNRKAKVSPWYQGHVYKVGPGTQVQLMADEGPETGNVFPVDRNNVPRWLTTPSMLVSFQLIGVGKAEPDQQPKRIAINVRPREQ